MKKKWHLYVLTIIGGLIFVGSQAWEWKNFINGEYGAVETKGGSIIQFVDKDGKRVALEDFAVIPEEREQLLEQREMVYGRTFFTNLFCCRSSSRFQSTS
jgi:cytochrome c oxidase subunit 3